MLLSSARGLQPDRLDLPSGHKMLLASARGSQPDRLDLP